MLSTRDVVNEVVNEEMITKIHDIVLNDQRMKVHEKTANISKECNKLYAHLGMKELSVKRVPNLLTMHRDGSKTELREHLEAICRQVQFK